MFCIATYPLMTFLVSKLQSFAVNVWICFVKAMGTHALQIQSFGFVKAKFPSLAVREVCDPLLHTFVWLRGQRGQLEGPNASVLLVTLETNCLGHCGLNLAGNFAI